MFFNGNVSGPLLGITCAVEDTLRFVRQAGRTAGIEVHHWNHWGPEKKDHLKSAINISLSVLSPLFETKFYNGECEAVMIFSKPPQCVEKTRTSRHTCCWSTAAAVFLHVDSKTKLTHQGTISQHLQGDTCCFCKKGSGFSETKSNFISHIQSKAAI